MVYFPFCFALKLLFLFISKLRNIIYYKDYKRNATLQLIRYSPARDKDQASSPKEGKTEKTKG